MSIGKFSICVAFVAACGSFDGLSCPTEAAELVFSTTALVDGYSRIENSPNANYYQLSRGWRSLAHFTWIGARRNNSMAESYSDLVFHGERNVKNIDITAAANPARVYRDAYSEIYTATRPNGPLDHITVAVKATSNSEQGRPVTVTVDFWGQSSISEPNSDSRNYFKLYVNGNKKVDAMLYRSDEGRGRYTIQTRVGNTFQVAFGGFAKSTRGTAKMDMKVTLSVPLNVR